MLPPWQALANAEATHSRALRAASHVNLVGDCDSAPLRTALQEFQELPYGLGQVSSLQPARRPGKLHEQQAGAPVRAEGSTG